MKRWLDSFWRATAYCVHPKVVLLSLLPLILMAITVLGLGFLYWEAALQWVRSLLEANSLWSWAWGWLDYVGLRNLKSVVAPLVVIFSITPLVVVMALLAVSFMMTPALVNLVAQRRFPDLQRKHGGSTLQGVIWSLTSALLALLVLILTLPMWWVPPLAMLLPALIWGWLTYRVMAFDVLAEHALREERLELLRRYRFTLLGMGVLTGMMGAAPSLIWASGALFAAAFVVLIPIAVWIYTLVFAFSALWFAHFLLDALNDLRNEPLDMQSPPVETTEPLVL